MAVGSGVPYNEHTGNGVTDTFAYGFTLLSADDFRATIDGVVTSAYTLTGLENPAGGTCEFDTAPADGAEILLERVVSPVRTTEYQQNGDLQARTVNNDFDRLLMMLQGQQAAQGGALRGPYPEQIDELPPAAERAGFQLLFHPTTGQPYLAAPVSGTAADVLLTLAAAGGADLMGYWLNALGSVERTIADRLRERKSLLDFGVVLDGSTNNAGALAAAQAYALAFDGPLTLFCPPGAGSLKSSSWPNWLRSDLNLHFEGTVLESTSASAAHVILDVNAFAGGGDSDPFIYNFRITGNYTLKGNSNTGHHMRLLGVSLGRVEGAKWVGGNPASTRALGLYGCVGLELSSCSFSTDAEPDLGGTNRPLVGIYLDDAMRGVNNVGGTTNVLLANVTVTGVAGTGWHFEVADQITIAGGAAQNCTRGVNVTANCRKIMFDHFGMEVNEDEDIVDAGEGTALVDCYSVEGDGGAGRAVFQGRSTRVEGGDYNEIEVQVDAEHPTFADLRVNHNGTGGFTNDCLTTKASGIYDTDAGEFIVVQPARVALTVGASPYSWTNDTGRWVQVFHHTGTISATTRTRPGDVERPTLAVGEWVVAPGEVMKWTHPGGGSTPTMSYQGFNELGG